MALYVPTVFEKNGRKSTAYTREDHVWHVFDGWYVVGEAPADPPFRVSVKSINGRLGPDPVITLDDLPDVKSEFEGRLSDTALTTKIAQGVEDAGRVLDPRNYGAVGDGTTDDTAALQACIDAAGASGTVELPALQFKITAPLLLASGTEIRGVGPRGSIIRATTDITAIKALGGQGQAIRSLKIWNTFVGTRTTYDIELVSPTKPIIADVEIDLPNANVGAGGVLFRKDAGVTGNSFMPQVSKLWVRNGTLRIDGVTDGKVTDSYVWSPGTGALGSIQAVNSASSWTFTNCDVVPPTGDCAGYYFHTVENIHVQGGLVDGSYADIMTGWGLRAINSFRLSVRSSFWNLGRGALDLSNVRASSFVGNVISRCNKADGAYSDINNVNGIGNVFSGNTHSCTVSRSNPGRIYIETGSATDNVIDCNIRETGTNYYHATPVVILGSTHIGPGNRPLAAWPRVLARSISASESMPQEAIFRGQITFITGSGVTETLPSAGIFYTGTTVTVKTTGGATAVLAAADGQTINGAASITLAVGEAVTVATSNSTAWQTISRYV